MKLRATTILNIRLTVGYKNKDARLDVVGALPENDVVEILEGPVSADGLEWFRFERGWVARTSPTGEVLLTEVVAGAAGSESAPSVVRLHPPVSSEFPISQHFGENPDVYARLGFKGHTGIDWATPVGSSIFAMSAGKVVKVANDPNGYGQFVKLQHEWGESLYAHLSRTYVVVGEYVAEGELIALSGNSGWSTGPHLHVQVRIAPFDTQDGMNGCSNFVGCLS